MAHLLRRSLQHGVVNLLLLRLLLLHLLHLRRRRRSHLLLLLLLLLHLCQILGRVIRILPSDTSSGHRHLVLVMHSALPGLLKWRQVIAVLGRERLSKSLGLRRTKRCQLECDGNPWPSALLVGCLTSSVRLDDLIEAIQIQIPSANLGKRGNWSAALLHQIKQSSHELLRSKRWNTLNGTWLRWPGSVWGGTELRRRSNLRRLLQLSGHVLLLLRLLPRLRLSLLKHARIQHWTAELVLHWTNITRPT